MARIEVATTVKALAPSTDGGFKQISGNRAGAVFTQDHIWQLSQAGRLVIASDADENDRITGATSFAATTPTLLLDVPSGSAAIPVWLDLVQAGTVAGDFIEVAVSLDVGAVRYSSGGTAETKRYIRTDLGFASSCLVYSAPTAAAANTAVAVTRRKLAEDVDLASADATAGNNEVHINFPRDYPGILLVGPASLLVFTYAGTTGPTWEWSLGFLDVPIGMLN